MADDPLAKVTVLAERCLDALASFDIPAVASLFSPGAVWRDLQGPLIRGERRGRGAVARLVIDLAQLTAGTFHRQIHDIVSTDEYAAAICTVTAEVRGQRETWGEVLVFRTDGQHITEVWAFPADAETTALYLGVGEPELQYAG